MTTVTVQYSALRTAYDLRLACLNRNWNAVKVEVAWAEKHAARITAERTNTNDVNLVVVRGNTTANETITGLAATDADQIIESLRHAGVQIKEAVQP